MEIVPGYIRRVTYPMAAGICQAVVDVVSSGERSRNERSETLCISKRYTRVLIDGAYNQVFCLRIGMVTEISKDDGGEKCFCGPTEMRFDAS